MNVLGGIGLAGERIALGPSTLVTHGPMHATLRTPSRGSWTRGNALHLVDPPDRLGRWFDTFDRTVGALPGVAARRVEWEVPAGARVDVPTDVDGVQHVRYGVYVLDGESLSPPLPRDVEVRRVDDDKTAAGARTLLLQGGWGKDVDTFRWRSREEEAIEAAGRGMRLVAYRFGIPLARIGVFHDGLGLAVLDNLVVHPLYRRERIGAALAGGAVDGLRAVAGPFTVVALAPDPAAGDLLRSLGFAPSGTVITAELPR